MNRIEFLKQTIYTNLDLIEKYNNKYNGIHQFELSLCNYDSKDGLDEYVKENLQEFIDNKILIYTKSNNHQYFNAGHAKNIAHKYSNGNILVGLDIDNILSEEFMEYIINIYSQNMNYVTHGVCESGMYGRICISRDNFYKLGGYPEILDRFGYEDTDLINRCEILLKCNVIQLNDNLIQFIDHSPEVRIENFECNNKSVADLEKNIYVNYLKMQFYINNNIINPNEYNNIIFGEK
jgi:predicted glycosyltransferase involved in capsule biosynthesis